MASQDELLYSEAIEYGTAVVASTRRRLNNIQNVQHALTSSCSSDKITASSSAVAATDLSNPVVDASSRSSGENGLRFQRVLDPVARKKKSNKANDKRQKASGELTLKLKKGKSRKTSKKAAK